MSQSVICYDPPAQLVQNVRAVYKIPRGVAVIPSTIKVLDLKVNPTNAQGQPLTCYFPALAGVWATISQIELKVGDKPVDLFLSKQASAFINSLGSPDMQRDITSQLTCSSNNIAENSDDNKVGNNPYYIANQNLTYMAVDEVSQGIELRKVIDYLNNRYMIDEGLSISITWDISNKASWLLDPPGGVPVANVNMQVGYLSYETVQDVNLPKQKLVTFRQTIEEQIIIPAIGTDETVQYWEQRMNSLRDKFLTRSLFVFQPHGTPANIADVRKTYGNLCSIGMLGEYLNIVIDGSQKLTFKGFSQPAHKLALTLDSWGSSSSSLTSWFIPKEGTLVDKEGLELSNYYSYLGADLETFVNKEVVIQYQRKSGVNANLPAQGAGLTLFMISQVLKQHNTETGVVTYLRL